MSDDKLSELIELFQCNMSLAIDSIPEKAIAKKYRKSLESSLSFLDDVEAEWNRIKGNVLQSEKDRLSTEKVEAFRLKHTLEEYKNSAQKEIEKFLKGRTNLTPSELEWADDTFVYSVQVEVAKKMLQKIEEGKTSEQLKEFAVSEQYDWASSLLHTTSTIRRLVNQIRSHEWARMVQWFS